MMLGDKVSAAEAERMNMIYKVFADDVFADEAAKIATNLASMPTKGLALTKCALNRTYINNLDQQLALEDELQTQAGLSYDYNEGVQAFLEKRKPIFKGE
jgi:2-(1,2-epoxy-1,2-dihydrophenyl)acetyl-CoA isomerase